jgi:phosphatidylinositol glycan class O
VGTIAILAHLEIVRDVRKSRKSRKVLSPSPTSPTSIEVPIIRFDEVVPLALLGLHMFYGTGHQAVFSTIQWKSAFLLTPTVTYPFAPLTVIINSFGSLFLVGSAVPLLALWNHAPYPRVTPTANADVDDSMHLGEDVAPALAALGIMAYFGSLLLGSAVSAAILRRHLMVWKVFAPRFIYGVVTLLVVNVSVLFGMAVGVVRIRSKVSWLFGDIGIRRTPA